MKRWLYTFSAISFAIIVLFVYINAVMEPAPVLRGEIHCHNQENPKPALTAQVTDAAGQPVGIELGTYVIDNAKGLTPYRISRAPEGDLTFVITCDGHTNAFLLRTSNRGTFNINCDKLMSCAETNTPGLGVEIDWP